MWVGYRNEESDGKEVGECGIAQEAVSDTQNKERIKLKKCRTYRHQRVHAGYSWVRINQC